MIRRCGRKKITRIMQAIDDSIYFLSPRVEEKKVAWFPEILVFIRLSWMLLPVEESYIVYSRCYFVLEHLLHMCPGCSSLCCRGCREVGMTPHIWWTCPKVRRFWICVHSLIHSVTLVNISKDAWVAFLNKPVDGIPRHMQTLFYFMFLAAKMAIATA